MTEGDLRKYAKRTGLGERSDAAPAAVPAPDYGAEKFWDIKPAPAPRQSERDKIEPSPMVRRYRAFCTECKIRKIWTPQPGDLVVFFIRVPTSRLNEQLIGMPHLNTPDFDNYLKALLDACLSNDSHIWTATPAKIWHPTGGIYIKRMKPIVSVPFLPRICMP